MKLNLKTTVRTNEDILSTTQIFWNFTQDTLLTGGIYLLLIIMTLILKYSSHTLESSSFHYAVVVFLEHAIFSSGSIIVLLIILYVTTVSILELRKSFLCALERAKPFVAADQISAERPTQAKATME